MIDTLYIHLTKRCNFNCLYCYFDSNSSQNVELSHQIISRIIDDLPSLSPCRIIFTGGEPLLVEDVIKIGERIKETNNKIIIGITTNGSLITEKLATDLVRVFDEIRISIDGPQEINDVLRGYHTFDYAMLAFKKVIEAGGNPSAFITATTYNVSHLKVFMKFLLSRGISKIHISPVKLIGKAQNKNIQCDIEELKETVEEFYFEQFGLKLKQIDHESFNCGLGKFISINPDGSVYPCHVLSFPELCIGNVKNENLSSIFYNSTLLKILRNLNFNEISGCTECFSRISSKNSCLEAVIRNNAFKTEILKYL